MTLFFKLFAGTRSVPLVISVLAIVAIFVNIHHLNKYTLSNNEIHQAPSTLDSNCDSILKYGRHLNDIDEEPRNWQPDGCALQHYRGLGSYGLRSCLRPGDEIIIFGDSTARQVYWGVLNLLFNQHKQFDGTHRDKTFQSNSITVRLVWDVFFNSSGSAMIHDIALNGARSQHRQEALALNKDPNYTPKLHLFITAGAWFPFLEAQENVVPEFSANFKRLLEIIDERADGGIDTVYIAPPFIPFYGILKDVRMTNMNSFIYNGMMRASDALFNYVRTNETVKNSHPAKYSGGVRYRTREDRRHEISSYYVPVFNELAGGDHRGLFDQMGIHFLEPAFVEQANILINHLCNQQAADGFQKLSPGNCCVKFKDYEYGENGWLIRLLFKAFIFLPLCLLMKASSNFKKLVPAAKFSAMVILVLGLVSTWARVSNQSQVISKISLVYSPQEFWGLIQAWLLSSLLSFVFSPVENSAPAYAQGLLAKPLVLEWQGVCVSLLILIQYSGFAYLKETFAGEMMVRLLGSTWVMLQLYQFTLDCLDSNNSSFSSPSNLMQSYKSLFPFFAYRIARVLTLPLLLHSSVTASIIEGTPATVAPSYIPLAIKLSYWYLFVFFSLPLIRHLFADIQTINRDLEKQSAALVCLSVVPFIFSPFLLYFSTASSKPTFTTVLNSFSQDYWVVLFAVWLAVYSKHKQKENSTSACKPSLQLALLAVIVATALFNWFFYLFSYYTPVAPNGPVTPISFLQANVHVRIQLLDARGKGYNALAHTVLVLSSAACYLVLRLRLLQTATESGPRYIGIWVRIAKSSYEALLLYPYIFLAAGGTLRLNYIPTGIVLSSQISLTFYFTPKSHIFNYASIALIGKVRKCVALLLSLGVFCTIIEFSSSVWQKDFTKPVSAPKAELMEEHELE